MMEKFPTEMQVVALALVRDDGLILMHRRPENKQHGGLWEFPGGKVEPDETLEIALVREAQEELGIELDAAGLVAIAEASGCSADGENTIVIRLYSARSWNGGEPQALEGGAVGWFDSCAILALDKPPLDGELAAKLFGSGAP